MSGLPPGFEELDRGLLGLARNLRLLAFCTPAVPPEERTRFIDRALAGHDAPLPFRYDTTLDGARARTIAHGQKAIAACRAALGRAPSDPAMGDLYEGRLDELDVEMTLVGEVRQAAFGATARRRYAHPDGRIRRQADAAAESFVHDALDPRASRKVESPPSPETLGAAGPNAAPGPNGAFASDAVIPTDDARRPDSLVACMGREVHRARLPFRVEVTDGLLALAATAEDVIYVAKGRHASAEATARTVAHEVHAHAVPRARARVSGWGLLLAGTARGNDAQEGYALVVEERLGFLRGLRTAELAARHHACRAMDDGATPAEAFRTVCAKVFGGRFAGGDGSRLDIAVRAVERAYRGGDGRSAGLGRDRVYVPHYCEVREALRRTPELESFVTAGQVGLEAARLLRARTFI